MHLDWHWCSLSRAGTGLWGNGGGGQALGAAPGRGRGPAQGLVAWRQPAGWRRQMLLLPRTHRVLQR